MKALALLALLVFASLCYSQSGRRTREIRTPVPAPSEPQPTPLVTRDRPPVTAEKNQDYRCTDDDSLAVILETSNEPVLSAKDFGTPAVITARPKPVYTREARRRGVQGFVTLRVLLSASGKIARVRVVKGLPAGLTENGIKAACRIEFKPALKNGQPVGQWLLAEYVFRLADSSIFAP